MERGSRGLVGSRVGAEVGVVDADVVVRADEAGLAGIGGVMQTFRPG